MGGIENQQRGLGQTWSKIKTAASTLKEKVGEPCITTSQHVFFIFLIIIGVVSLFCTLCKELSGFVFWEIFSPLDVYELCQLIHIKWANSFWVY